MSKRANIQAVIDHLEKVGRHSRYTYNANKCAVRKHDLERTDGCAIHHVMWTFTVTDQPLLKLRNDMREFAASTRNAYKLFDSSEFTTYLDENFWNGAAAYFRQPSADFNDMLNHLRNRADVSTPTPEPEPEPAPAPTVATPNETVTLTYGFITMQLPANDPKVKELLAYLAEKLV